MAVLKKTPRKIFIEVKGAGVEVLAFDCYVREDSMGRGCLILYAKGIL